ncbi:hypothetical protein HLB44_18535 [Aquincola sp. S2]|uniref:DUF2793 domain-containing protein n=1 Tax=Pseudaquabacterium terrae TaxID=2732868 RepID=A0ABX2EK87_9BURK|nr:hypothetical protein [Aquabacterium terrae]NRF68995.1 hypothetical protein [Aquabacterium terrae]
MSLVTELVPGLVLHLDPKVLQQAGGQTTVPGAVKVQDKHFFACLSEDKGTWRLMPCYTSIGPERLPIEEKYKIGHHKWKSGTSYFHPKQVWTVSAAAIEAAALAGGDMSRPGARNWIDIANTPDLP